MSLTAFRCPKPSLTTFAIAIAIGSVFAPAVASAQFQNPPGRHFPLNQRLPPGTVSGWHRAGGLIRGTEMQPVSVSLPIPAKVTFFNANLSEPVTKPTPGQIGLLVGQVYRFVLSEIDGKPGLSLYPTVELVDRLHPPYGLLHHFPVPLHFTAEELEAALNGKLVTKVVYLEQPQRAIPIQADPEVLNTKIQPNQNLLAQADVRGRPVAILRLGGRRPNPHQPDPGFFGHLPPIFPSDPPPAADAPEPVPATEPLPNPPLPTP